ncbi:2-hydroxyacid dehydrogenase [Paracoccus sulfuroxidans]|uniref:Glyoxylate/hydroxypyruvate reductase A n=1 Tax=Paracoccus sulfuroxidans TaxID=384678 RepID=A0A562NHD3_9RHOB|nr:glyoxylate/hydroxypyruvate reductase A [Paracoccus sulfuroxidans]TWI31546.1 glyoxylate/hydroxypyruvate reductase A [Paracoccus sulfuroxidans]
MPDQKKALLIIATGENAEEWRSELVKAAPTLDIHVLGEEFDPATIAWALVWRPPVGYLASLPNLEAIFSMAAGVDHIFADDQLPQGIPVVKLVHEATRQQHRDYVLHAVIHHHRDMMLFAERQPQKVWKFVRPAMNAQRSIGLMGAGPLGIFAAEALVSLGYQVRVWSRSPKSIDGAQSFHGTDQLHDFAAGTDILVSMLPKTPETIGILDAALFAALPEGAAVVNIGRGDHLDEGALLAALNSGHLSGATLDVLAQEPPAEDHPFWTHSKVRLTPHIASEPNPWVTAMAVLGNIDRMQQGLAPEPRADRASGY